MNMTSAPCERGDWFSSCEASTKKWDSGREQGNINQRRGRGGSMKSLLAASTTGIHQRLSRQLPWVGNELVLSVCVLKQARGALILPNQGPRWHIPSVIFLLLFCSDIKMEQGETCLVSFAVEYTSLHWRVMQLSMYSKLHLCCSLRGDTRTDCTRRHRPGSNKYFEILFGFKFSRLLVKM